MQDPYAGPLNGITAAGKYHVQLNVAAPEFSEILCRDIYVIDTGNENLSRLMGPPTQMNMVRG